MQVAKELQTNIKHMESVFPVGKSFDIITRNLYFGDTKAYWLGVNGLCNEELLQKIFSDLQNPIYMNDTKISDIKQFMDSKMGYIQTSLADNYEQIVEQVVSGPSVLFMDGFDQAILIDVRTYPTRSVGEPETERVTNGARDGFVEALVVNANLIRRRIRSPQLTFERLRVGTESQTDVAVAYLDGVVNEELLTKVRRALQTIQATGLTMGARSLEELLVKKHWYHPLPNIHDTERPDVACSFLSEGHILLLVDTSPLVLILPCTIFQFTQSPEDYYKNPMVGTYYRLARFLCIPISLFLLPVFLLITAYFPDISEQLGLLKTQLPGPTLVFYVFAVEFLIVLFQYSASLSSGRFSGALSLIGGLIIGEIAVDLKWASPEILFYAAVTLLTSISLSSIAFSDGLRMYRLFLIAATGLFGAWGFGIGCALVLLSVITTPVFGGMSYFWPLVPFEWKALRTLLFRYPTAKAQPVGEKSGKREK